MGWLVGIPSIPWSLVPKSPNPKLLLLVQAMHHFHPSLFLQDSNSSSDSKKTWWAFSNWSYALLSIFATSVGCYPSQELSQHWVCTVFRRDELHYCLFICLLFSCIIKLPCSGYWCKVEVVPIMLLIFSNCFWFAAIDVLLYVCLCLILFWEYLIWCLHDCVDEVVT
jgi:hypothetical protein